VGPLSPEGDRAGEGALRPVRGRDEAGRGDPHGAGIGSGSLEVQGPVHEPAGSGGLAVGGAAREGAGAGMANGHRPQATGHTQGSGPGRGAAASGGAGGAYPQTGSAGEGDAAAGPRLVGSQAFRAKAQRRRKERQEDLSQVFLTLSFFGELIPAGAL